MSQSQHILFPFLKYLGVPFTNHYLTEVTSAMPSSDTLLGISNILRENYETECVCLRIEKNDIFKLDTPFIVQFSNSKNSLAVVTDVKPSRVSLVYRNRTFIYSKVDLFASWNGVVLLAEPKETSREANYWQHFRIETLKTLRFPVIIIATAALLAYFGKTNLLDTGWRSISLLLTYLFGTVLSGLLLSQSVKKLDSFVERVCSSREKNGCSKILEGNASKIFGLIGWSEIGFVYFIGSFLTLLFVKQSIGILFFMSVSALPYTFWSIYYQWKIANQWCPFCVSVQVTLWVVFFLCLTSPYSLSMVVNIHHAIHAIACFLVPALFLWLLMPFAKSHHELKQLTVRYKSLKFNEEIIASALKLNPPVDISDASSIIFGNSDSTFAITVVTSLYCPHCVKANKHLKELLHLYGEKVSLQIVFKIPNPSATTHRYEKILIKHLIDVYKSYDLATAEAVYHQLYDKGINDYKKLIKLHPVSEDIPAVNQEIEKQTKWLDKIAISGTPTVFVNGYRLPRWYDVSDLKYLLFSETANGINNNVRSRLSIK